MKSLLRFFCIANIVFLATSALTSAAPLHDGAGGPKDIGNSAPPGIGGDGPYQSLKMDLLARLPLNEIGAAGANVLGSDCWGWTDPQTGKEYAIACLTNATSFIDISDPTNPQYLGKVNTTTGNSTWRDCKVYDNHVFIVSDSNGAHGMQVFDLTNLRTANPNNPQVYPPLTTYNGIGSAHNIAINEDTGFAYIVGSSQAAGGLHVVDISTPSNPVFAGNFSADGYTHDAQIVVYNGPDADYVGREIAFASNEDTLTIVDVTTKSNMTQISRNGYPQDAYTHQCWVTEDQRYIFLCDELDESNFGGGTRTHVWDLLDLDAPVYLGFHSGNNASIDHNLYIKDGLIYLASYSAGVRVLEIDDNDAAALNEIAFFDTFATDTDTDFDGCWSLFPYYESGVVFANDRQNGLFVVRMSPIEFNYTSPRPELISPAGGTTFEVEVTGFQGTPEPGTGVLHVDRGNGFEQFPMSESSLNNYTAAFPSSNCGDVIVYYVSAESADGSVITDPANAPTTTFQTLSADGIEVTFEDDFEAAIGWAVSGDATDGQWERGVPVGNNRGDPGADGDGSGSCYVTDNDPNDSNSDVDGGSTILVSPTMDAIGTGTGVGSMISYYRWYSNDIGNAPASDIFEVEISNNDGASWVELETIGPGGNEVSGGWIYKSFSIEDFVTPTNQMRLRFTASDLGDGSVVEAAVDGIKIQFLQCNEDPVVVVPDSIATTRGTFNVGDVSSVEESDNADYSISRSTSDIQSRTEFTVTASSPTQSPTTFDITVEGSVFARTAVNQTIELFNYGSNSWESVDMRAATRFSDSTVTVSPTGDLGRFVAANGEIQARVRFQSVAARQRFTSNTDLFTWTIQ